MLDMQQSTLGNRRIVGVKGVKLSVALRLTKLSENINKCLKIGNKYFQAF